MILCIMMFNNANSKVHIRIIPMHKICKIQNTAYASYSSFFAQDFHKRVYIYTDLSTVQITPCSSRRSAVILPIKPKPVTCSTVPWQANLQERLCILIYAYYIILYLYIIGNSILLVEVGFQRIYKANGRGVLINPLTIKYSTAVMAIIGSRWLSNETNVWIRNTTFQVPQRCCNCYIGVG